jgi:2-polyprenyl-6-hydroxyphenyl methylase / 3-demethylubiquinone-9 3-methyltransferase
MNTHGNVDPAEVAKFSELAHSWWDPQGELKSLHDINPLRLGWIQNLCPLQGMHVVDIGCGGGLLTHAMAQAGAHVLGIDLATKSLQVAKLHALEVQSGETYRHISAEALAQEAPASVDVVTCMEMLEHVPDPDSVIAACATLVKPGGWVFFSTINRTPRAFGQAIVAAEYVLGLVPRGTHEYAKLIRPSEMARACRAHGLELVATRGLTYNPFSKRYFLVDDVGVNYMVAARRGEDS